MRVQHGEGRVFLGKVLQGGDQDRVLEHIGMVACVEGVAITEHGSMVTSAPCRLPGPGRGGAALGGVHHRGRVMVPCEFVMG